MSRPPWVLTSNKAFRERYQLLQPGDLLLGRISLKKGEEALFLDLASRGVQAYPPLLAQALSRSKTFQARVLSEFMPPGTLVIYDRHDLLRALGYYGRMGVQELVSKADRANCGLGIHLWRDIEEVYNHAGYPPLEYPFVLQPRFRELRDIRVVILGDYWEAYERQNPYNFRNNIYFGGQSASYVLSPEENQFCKLVLERGHFPYAHLDLIYCEKGGPFLNEINLRGGLKGALITQEDYEKKVEALSRAFLKAWLKENPGAQVF